MDIFKEKFTHKMMGVINITPDSFSDGDSDLDLEKVSKQVKTFHELHCHILDIGAVSTAPTSKKVEKKEEIERFEKLLYPLLEKKIFNDDCQFSVDTYRPEVFIAVREKILEFYPEATLYFNDVSGLIPENFNEIMSSHEKTFYVYSHNQVPTREETNGHIDYIKNYDSKEDLLFDLINHFSNASFKFMSSGLGHRVVFDPCFGFAKNSEQNLWLLDILGKLIKTCSIETKWLLGISRKSFLQEIVSAEYDISKDEAISRSEYYHALLLAKFMKSFPRNEIIYRLHDPVVFDIAKKFVS